MNALFGPPHLVPCRKLWLGKRVDRFCLIDEIDWPWVSQHNWTTIWHAPNKHKDNRDYVRRNYGPDRKTLYLHREIMLRCEPPPGLLWEITHVVHHRNCNPLDNRRANLCWATRVENAAFTRRHARIPTLEEILATLPVPLEYEIPF